MMPIFVGGTGRSGTTVLADIIGQHPEVWHVPTETRFLVDPGGVEDLVRALSTEYTPFHGSDALTRFTTILTQDVAGQAPPGALVHADLPAIFGAEPYADWSRRFLAALTWYAFNDRATERIVGRYFADRSELLALCRSFVDELFSAGARTAGKSRWCEKTPNNMLEAEFLWDLFPDAQFLHIVRHPVQVAASHLSMEWAPDDIASACNWLEPMYQQWLAGKSADAPRCRQLRLEDLAADWARERRALFDWLGLPDADTALAFTPDRIAHWAPMSAADESYVRERLGFAIEAFGYR
jgi:hypothetical protein